MKCKQIREQIKEKAEVLGLDSAHLNKKEVIHAIQVAEGNFPCFLTAKDFCNQANCCWRADCLASHWRDDVRLQEVKRELQALLTTIAGDGTPLHYQQRSWLP